MRGAVRKFLRSIGRVAAVAGTVIASVALSVLALEAALRMWDGVPLTSTENFVASELNAVVNRNNPVTEYDDRLGWVARSNSSFGGGDLTIGEYGVRMPTTTIVPLQQGAVLMVGDSFGAGSEVPSTDSWPAQLERTLSTQVINAGVGGYGLDQIILRAEILLPLLKPRMLLVQTRLDFGLSVSRMSIFGGAPKPYFTADHGLLVFHNNPVPRLASARSDIGWARSLFGYSYLVQYIMTRLDQLQWWVSPGLATKFAVSTGEAVDVSCLLVQRLAQIRDRDNIRVALVLQYSAVDVMNSTLPWGEDRARFIACAKRAGLEIVDVLDTLRSVYQTQGLSAYQKLWMMHDNNRVYGHMSPEGNRLIANLIFQQLFSRTTSEAKVR